MSLTNARNTNTAYLAAAEDLRRNPQQWAFYESRGNCVVLAGPGSGKTKALTIKMARMLAEDVRTPHGIACITFSTECARELQRRLDSLGIKPSASVFVGTVHSFCLQKIVLPYAHLAGMGLPEPLKVADTGIRDRIFKAAVCQVCPHEKPRNMRTRFERYRLTQVDKNAPEWKAVDETSAMLIETYENGLRSEGYVDFDDMILCGLHLVEEHEWVRKLVKARFPIMIIDEYQDLGLPLHRIVLSLSKIARMRIVAVGDPDQSIYGFTGAQPELLQELAGKIKAEETRFRLNYRCGKTIVHMSKVALGEDRGYDTPHNAPLGTIDFHECVGGLDEQAEHICQNIIPSALERITERQLGDIAVLYVDKYDGDVIAGKANEAHLPFIRIDTNAAYRKTPLTRWIEDCASWCSGGWKQAHPPLSGLLKTWMQFNRTITTDEMILTLRRDIIRFLFGHRTPDASVGVWLGDLSSTCLFPMLEREKELVGEKEALTRMHKSCSAGGQIGNFTVSTLAGQRGAPDHLSLITLHSAKGREFDVVIMMGLEQGRIPHFKDGPDQKSEKRRLFYVGMTRAKYEVHLTYSGWFNWYGNRQSQGPSEYLVEVRNRLEEYEDY